MTTTGRLPLGQIFLEGAAVVVSLAIVQLLRPDDVTDVLVRIGLLLGAWTLVSVRLGRYTGRIPATPGRLVETWFLCWAIAGLCDAILLQTPRGSLALLLPIGAVTLFVFRELARHVQFGKPPSTPNVLIVGTGSRARALATDANASRSMNLRGFLHLPGEPTAGLGSLEHLGAAERLAGLLGTEHTDLVLLCPSLETSSHDIHEAIRTCSLNAVEVQYFPTFLQLGNVCPSLVSLVGRSSLQLCGNTDRPLLATLKRLIDLSCALAAVIVLLPVLITCAVLVRLGGKGPIFYRQERVGENGRRFDMLKFRTMHVNAHAMREQLRLQSIQDGPAFKIPNDPRITRFGRLLRKYSLDELPQLFNVLAGDMSLVGPRPPTPDEVVHYDWWQRRRLSVRPGLTCVWQVWGRNKVSFKRWIEMDLYYIDNWSMWMDLKLIAHTFRVVLSGSGM